MLREEILGFMTVLEWSKFLKWQKKRPCSVLKGLDSEYKDYYLGDVHEFLNIERAGMREVERKQLEEQPQEVPMWARSKRKEKK